MNATDERLDALLAELDAIGAKLKPTDDGNLTIDAPKGTLTRELKERLKAGKADLVARLTEKPTGVSEPPVEVPADDQEIDDYPTDESEVIDPAAWNGCPTCGSLDGWEACAGDPFGKTPGRWRCLTCDSPEASRRMLAVAAWIRADEALRKSLSRR